MVVRLAQRLASLCITGALTTEAKEITLELPPTDLFIMAEASKAAYRLKCVTIWRTYLLGHARIMGTISHPILRRDTKDNHF